MFTAPFWKATVERAVRTAAQALLSLWLVGDGILNAFNLDWGKAAGVSLGAAVLSVVTSLVAGVTNPTTGPSFGTETPAAPLPPVR